jgi:hypothetical protein
MKTVIKPVRFVRYFKVDITLVEGNLFLQKTIYLPVINHSTASSYPFNPNPLITPFAFAET